MIRNSDSVKTAGPAFRKAQMEFKPVVKDCSNPFHKSKYASLEAHYDALKPALNANGFSIQHGSHVADGLFFVVTRLLHDCGEWFETEVPMTLESNTAQKVGSAITYGRRYGLGELCAVASEEDDDGHAASARDEDWTPPQAERQPSKPKPQVKTDAPKMSTDELTVAILKATKNTELAQLGMQIKYQPEADRPGLSKVYNDRMNVLLKGKAEGCPSDRDELPAWAGGNARPVEQ